MQKVGESTRCGESQGSGKLESRQDAAGIQTASLVQGPLTRRTELHAELHISAAAAGVAEWHR